MRKQSEEAFHVQTAQFLSKALPPEFIHTCFPAGGGGAIRGAKLKAKGLRKGMPDHLIIAPEGWPKPLLWLELKTKTGRPSEEQLATHALLRGFGHRVEIVKNLETIQRVLAEWCYPLELRCRVTL